MKYLKLSFLVQLLIVVFASSSVASASPAWRHQTWSVVKSPSPGSAESSLSGVSVLSPRDAWAVGSYSNNATTGPRQTLIEHWNGTRWKVVDSPDVGTGSNILEGVAALSASDIWAVGSFINQGAYNTLIEHWNGTRWSVVPSPNIRSKWCSLSGVSIVTRNDVWAVGSSNNNTGSNQKTLIEHWNGRNWMVINSPNPGSARNFFSGVSAISSKNAWAVGSSFQTTSGPAQTLIEYWNGTRWSVVSSPNVGSFAGVAALSPKNVWAVGSSLNSATGLSQTLIERWNGTRWNMVNSPNIGSFSNSLSAVSAISPNNALSVGSYYDDTRNILQTLIEYWNGTSWSVVKSPNVGSFTNNLLSVAALSPKNVWAVGYYFNAHGVFGIGQTLTEHCC